MFSSIKNPLQSLHYLFIFTVFFPIALAMGQGTKVPAYNYEITSQTVSNPIGFASGQSNRVYDVTFESKIYMSFGNYSYLVYYKDKLISQGLVTDLEVDPHAMGSMYFLPVKDIYFKICNQENIIALQNDAEFKISIPFKQSDVTYRLRINDIEHEASEVNALYKAFEIVNDPIFEPLLKMPYLFDSVPNNYLVNVTALNKYLFDNYIDSSRLHYLNAFPVDLRDKLLPFRNGGKVEIKVPNYDELKKAQDTVTSEQNRYDYLVTLVKKVCPPKIYSPNDTIIVPPKYKTFRETLIIQSFKNNLKAIETKSTDLLNDLFESKHHVPDMNSLVRGQENGGSGDFTNVAAGMSRFLADRAMQELNESFFMMMEKQMTKMPHLEKFFPATKNYLTQVKDQQRFINLDYIKGYFEKDIKQFPINFYRFKDEYMLGKQHKDGKDKSFQNAFKVNMNYTINGRWINLGLDAMNNSGWGTSPMHLINSLVHSDKALELNEMLHVERMLAKIVDGRGNSQQLVNKEGELVNSKFLDELSKLLDCSSSVNTSQHISCSKDKCANRNFVRKALIYDGKATADYVSKVNALKNKRLGDISGEDKKMLEDLKEACASLLRYKLNSYLILHDIILKKSPNISEIQRDWKEYVNKELDSLPIEKLINKAVKLNDFTIELFKDYGLSNSKHSIFSKSFVQDNFSKISSSDIESLIQVRLKEDFDYKETIQYKKLLILDYYCDLLEKEKGDEYRADLFKKTISKENIVKQFNLYNALKLIDLISTQLVDNNKGKLWTDHANFERLIDDSLTFGKFVDELMIINKNVKEYDIHFYREDHSRLSLVELLDPKVVSSALAQKGIDKIQLFRKFIKDVYHTYDDLNQLVYKVKEKSTEADRLTNLNQIFSTVEDLMEVSTEYFYYYSGREIKFDPGVIFNTIGPCINFAHNIRKKDYHLAIEDVLLILGNFTDKGFTNKNYNKFLGKMSTYGNVVAKVAVAENSDQVKAAIESSVLPVGSSRMKRYADFSITLNSYVGVFGGMAMYKERVDGNIENRSLTTFGMTAPIGLGFNWGKIRLGNARTAISLNAQIFDLGTLVNFYMKHGDEAMLPESTKIRFKDIIAPGFTAAWSLGNTPLSLIGGVQFIPNLNQMGISEGEQKFQSLAWRAQMGLAIDIPLYNIKVWNK